MKNRTRLGAIGVAVLLGVAGCGGDESDAVADQSGEDAATTAAPPDAAADDGGADNGDEGAENADGDSSPGDGGDDILADFLAGSGLTTDIVTDEQHECMNAELRPRFPDGLPETLAEEDVDAVDAAAETCGVTL